MPHIPDDLWGKIRRQNPSRVDSPVVAWLPLTAHCADVAAAFEALMTIRGIRKRASRLLGRKITDQDISRLAVFAFLHDIGKGNAGFQFKVFPERERAGIAPAGHLAEAAAFLMNQRLLQLAADRLPLEAMESWFRPDSSDLIGMLAASWSHHGTPLCMSLDVDGMDGVEPPCWKSHKWSSPEAVLDLFGKEIREHFASAFEPGPAPVINATPRFQAFFAGILSLADWIGSSERWFDFDAHGTESRMAWSRRRAVQVLHAMGVDVENARSMLQGEAISYIQVFDFEPNAMQSAMEQLDITRFSDGSTVLLESETGSGKTEAAIFHAVRLFAAGLIDSVYFALPTRTSGVQIHKRLHKAIVGLFRDYAPPVVLAVPGYMTQHDGEALLTGAPNRWDDDLPGGRQQARSWFNENAKRYLAAPFAAGTIDQVLMSTLKLKHAHMRAACLSRSLLIVDEVHASDTYMSEITAETVRRHTSAGGHVLLMSATLAASAAVRYLGGREPALQDASAMAYPMIRWKSGKMAETIALDSLTAGRARDIQIRLVTCIADARAVAVEAAEHARRGARVLVIRNTVGACTETRRELELLLPPEMTFRVGDGVHACHHGRYAPEDRRLLDQAVETEFGKQRPEGGMVLVATQTVEQSLDIDADILITDICPMDVLLQRIGRLHRHLRLSPDGTLPARPAGYEHPVCLVLDPVKTLPLTLHPAHGIGLERAYQDVRIVELTRRAIAAHGRFVIPAMNRELVETCMHSDTLAALETEDPAWGRHKQKVVGGEISDRLSAKASMLCIDESFGTKTQFEGWTSAEKIQTRLGASPISAVFAEETAPKSPFGSYPLPVISIPHWMAPKALQSDPKTDAVPELVGCTGQGFTFRLGGDLYSYSPDGLAKA